MADITIAPSGNDTSPGTNGSPKKTWSAAITAAGDGGRVRVKDGTYTVANNGRLHYSGALDNLTIESVENERQAILEGDGDSVISFTGIDSLYLAGLTARNVDNAAISSAAAIIDLNSCTNGTMKRMLAAFSNRYSNQHGINLPSSNNMLVEECEVWKFHRHGIGCTGSLVLEGAHNNIFRRCYANGANWPNLAGGYASGNSSGGDGCFVNYPGRNNVFENCIGEGSLYGHEEQAPYWNSLPVGGSEQNRYLGNIYIGGSGGFQCQARGSTLNHMLHDSTLENILCIGQSSFAIRIREGRNNTVQNITVVLTQNMGSHAIQHDRQGTPSGLSPFTWTVRNISIDTDGFTLSGSGISTDTGGGVTHSGYSDCNVYNAITGYAPATSNTDCTTSNPNRGDTNLWVITTAGTYNTGVGGTATSGASLANKGADILYAYVGGLITTTPLWDPNNGGRWAAAFTGAEVSGINNSGNRLANVHERITPDATPRNTWPVGYDGTVSSTVTDPFTQSDGILTGQWVSGNGAALPNVTSNEVRTT